MPIARIAAGAIIVILGISGVALASGFLGANMDAATAVDSPAVSATVDTEAAVFAALTPSTSAERPSTTFADSTTSTSLTSTTGGSSTSTTFSSSTSTTFDDRSSTTSGSTSTTHPGSDDRTDDRSIVSLGLRTHTVADAGTVTVDGMTVLAVSANPGWQVEIDEASHDRIKIEFHNGEQEVEFELRADGELRVKSED